MKSLRGTATVSEEPLPYTIESISFEKVEDGDDTRARRLALYSIR